MTQTDGHLLDDIDHRDRPHPDPHSERHPDRRDQGDQHPGLLGSPDLRDSGEQQDPDPRRDERARRRAEAAEWRDAFAALFDPVTFRHFEGFGVGPGWRCWEAGAGGTSVVSWLAKKVGPTGKVVATATDTSWADSPSRPPVEVRVHDVSAQDPPGEGFDLVHARLVLGRVPDRERALRSMIKALRPGGRLLVEDSDPALQPLICPDEHGPEQELANRLRKGVRTLLTHHGIDVAHGRTLPRLLREAGLRQVEADACFPVSSPAGAALESATIRQVRDRLVTAGLATDHDIDRHLSHVSSGTLDLAAPALISAWGRKA
ncbi:methyltransferase domain-containing protein [Streptomyces sp. NPDC093094]|uniref:methyltransferase domain-containing protein n=1 Tax=Streptomyces sp. NPDC093094 TaxID=3366026 RepID=UPI0037FECEAA